MDKTQETIDNIIKTLKRGVEDDIVRGKLERKLKQLSKSYQDRMVMLKK